ncbi:uncharacterized protein F4812DRAFT_411414 [Daldinia caldariorum]|uniref:uncharacterized protein n=1 Tax=Daldinia caldariorum TaxID=326644 RepID=UPI00200847BC|nr:uncharacterized protein F4812DRAFT_411414 [Daldinia caldariorum]KAI1473062.1 hypothetical protein F4812DRAFT_411414 [Daldinia caldariorum]
MASYSVSTPSPPGRVHTPGTPKFGYNDSWEPFSPRKSARISAQRSTQRTPSPRAPQHRTRASTKTSSDASTTPVNSSLKKRQPAMDSVRRASSALTLEGATNAADSLGISSQHKTKASTSTSRAAAMFPTPAKTPKKQPDEKSKANVRAIARSLFSETDAIATPKKRKAKKYTGLTLDSFTAEDVNEPIEIFTDTRDRIPEADDTAANPFYEKHPAPATAEPPKSPKKRGQGKLISVPGEGKQPLDEVLQREDGIIYVFRGKRIFRKFSAIEDLDSDEAESESGEAELNGAESRERLRPLTRSSIKPRLLFPTKGKNVAKPTTDDEEAATDIEDHVFKDVDKDVEEEEKEIEVPATPTTKVTKKPGTPVSPPSTVRTRRTTFHAKADVSPLKVTKSRSSPFDGWRRSKSRATAQGQKREGDELARPNEPKRQRA